MKKKTKIINNAAVMHYFNLLIVKVRCFTRGDTLPNGFKHQYYLGFYWIPVYLYVASSLLH